MIKRAVKRGVREGFVKKIIVDEVVKKGGLERGCRKRGWVF